ncbi:hypothetical protein CNMCM7691_006254 [Aspergillus felis]|uniref:Uncharacterized protein n=1 Tax=Aspergillus felis TaxID=1287682 RepID=A0A8H6R777_9EURO|nr:hypothetical protein CNMCM7691_006254 [Aspergillus felis]
MSLATSSLSAYEAYLPPRRLRLGNSFRGRPTFAGGPRASHPAMCPGQLATALRHQAAARAPEEWTTGRAPTAISARQLARARGGGDPREPVVAGPPASPEKGVWPPSKGPALPDPLMGGYLTAYTTRLVTSVVCRGFIPARGDIAIRQPAPGGFSPGAVASLLRCMARRPIRIQLRRAGLHRRVPARILT